MKISYSSISEVGSRQNNEDCIAILSGASQDSLFALADGLGGHGCGEVASQMAVQAALKTFEANAGRDDSMKQPGDLLAECFQNSQDAIMLEQQLNNISGEMKTTLVLLQISASGKLAQWGHIGDSRLYWFSNGKLSQRTLDHSVPQMLVVSGEIREKDIRRHEDRNRLLRVMGMEWHSPKYQIANAVSLSGNDSFLLCTDGFWEYINERQMQRYLRAAKTPEDWLNAMLKKAEKSARGSTRDNFSAITVFVRP
jgi:serine/threonine protein phosphatase PrpC